MLFGLLHVDRIDRLGRDDVGNRRLDDGVLLRNTLGMHLLTSVFVGDADG